MSAETQTDRTEPGELGMEVVTGASVDGTGAGTGQHDVAGLEPHTEARDFAGQPGDRDHRDAEHRVAAALGDDLTVAGQDRVDALDVDVAGCDALLAEHPPRGGSWAEGRVGKEWVSPSRSCWAA